MIYDAWHVSMYLMVVSSAWEYYVGNRQKNKLKDMSIPKEAKMFEHIWKIDEKEYMINKKYGSDKMAVSGYKNMVSLAFDIMFYYFGGFQYLWSVSGDISKNIYPLYFIRIVIFSLIKQTADIILFTGFSYYSQFVVEERYGFNKMTIGVFVMDIVKSFILELIMSSIIFTGMVYIVDIGGSSMPIYLGGFISILIIVFMLIWPNFIAPLYNKFEVLGIDKDEKEVDLKRRVEQISKKAQFPVAEVYKMDGSKRSAHSQAYFFGIFKKKRIVIYDTLIKQLDNEQTEAVLCHEIGHWYHSHNVHMIVISLCVIQLLVWTMSFFLYDPAFYRSFGIDTPDYFLGVSLSMLMFGPISNIISLIMVRVSRRNEFQADEYALKYDHGENLIWALVKIYKENKADFDPDPLYSAVKHTHPTLIQRVKNIQTLLKK